MGMPFMGAVLLLDLVVLKTAVVKSRECWMVMAMMLLVTAVFDQLLTGLPIVHYNDANISGIKIGNAPVEDFMYTIAAVIGLGSLGKYYEKYRKRQLKP